MADEQQGCGTCTACCKIMGVADFEPPKPVGRWCEHCAIGEGCMIYPQRPASCREFACIWLQARERKDGDAISAFPNRLRPDRCGVVFTCTVDGTGLIAHCDPSTPLAWMRDEPLARLRMIAHRGHTAAAIAGSRYWLITRDGERELPREWLERGPDGVMHVRVPFGASIRLGIGPDSWRR